MNCIFLRKIITSPLTLQSELDPSPHNWHMNPQTCIIKQVIESCTGWCFQPVNPWTCINIWVKLGCCTQTTSINLWIRMDPITIPTLIAIFKENFLVNCIIYIWTTNCFIKEINQRKIDEVQMSSKKKLATRQFKHNNSSFQMQ